MERAILDLVDEDLYGVWEVGWRLRSGLGVDPEEDARLCADVIESLTQRGLVALYVREGVDGRPEPLPPSTRSFDLTASSMWLAPEADQRQVLVGPPLAGTRGLPAGTSG